MTLEAQTDQAASEPTVIVSHLDITYRVVGADRPDPDEDETPGLLRFLQRGRDIGRVREVPAVRDVSFVAHHGESIGIIGRNGSGKSTLLRAVAGLIPPTNGRVWVAGRPSLLGVNAVLMPKLTGARNIHLGCQALGMTREQVREKFDDIVEFSGIGEAVWLPMSTYSSGMAARLRFAISTAVAPDVLMVDEALATGDAEFRARSTERIREIRSQAGTVFLVSHSNSNIRDICTRVLWIDRGRLIADGPTEDVLGAYEASLPRKQSKAAKTPEPEIEGVERWAGPTDSATSVEVSQRTVEPGVGAVVITNADPALVLPMLPPATRNGWPLLVTDGPEVSDRLLAEVARLEPGRVILLGDESLITPQVADRLDAAGHVVERWPVRTGEDASTLGLQEMLSDPADVVVVASTSQPRRAVPLAIRSARQGEPVVVTDGQDLGDPLRQALIDCGAQAVRVLGGAGIVSDQVLAELAELVGPVEVIDLGSPLEGYAAAGGAADVSSAGRVVAVSTAVGPPTLVGVAAALRTGDPVVGVTRDAVPGTTLSALRRLQPSTIALVAPQVDVAPTVLATLGEFVS